MKVIRINKIIMLLICVLLAVFSCSKNDDNVEEEMITKCYVIEILDTDLPITNTRITFSGRFGCCCGGCGLSEIGFGTTNDMGEVCVTLSQLDFNDIERIAGTLNGTYYEGIFDFSSNLTVIYVDTLF